MTVFLTKSVARSLRPRTVRTMRSGIMLMYHGTDEMKGTHYRPRQTESIEERQSVETTDFYIPNC